MSQKRITYDQWLLPTPYILVGNPGRVPESLKMTQHTHKPGTRYCTELVYPAHLQNTHFKEEVLQWIKVDYEKKSQVRTPCTACLLSGCKGWQLKTVELMVRSSHLRSRGHHFLHLSSPPSSLRLPYLQNRDLLILCLQKREVVNWHFGVLLSNLQPRQSAKCTACQQSTNF